MKKSTKRWLSLTLTLVMLLGMVPAFTPQAKAASSHGITINAADHGSVAASVNGSPVTSAEEGATVTLTANPESGYRLKGISGTYKSTPQENQVLNSTKIINGTYFDLSATDAANAGWILRQSSITLSSKDNGVNIDKVEFNIYFKGNSFSLNNVACSAGTMSLNGNTLSVSSVNAATVTLSSNVNSAGSVRFNSVTISGSSPLSISTTDDVNVHTFTMPAVVEGDVSITAEFEKLPTFEVTYKVVGGTWSDDSTTDKTETVQSGSKPASVPTGMKASEGYTGGAWDTAPADTTISEAKTFTYTFIAKQAATVTKAPTANNLIYTDSEQELVTAGEAEGGTMQYALGNATEATEPYTTSVPTATDAGTYYVWYKVAGDDNHNDTDAQVVSVTIYNTYTVTFVDEDGSRIETQNVEAGGKATEPEAPTKDGYIFGGWTLNGEDYDFSFTVTEDIELKAKWLGDLSMAEVTLSDSSFDYDGTEKSVTYTVKCGDTDLSSETDFTFEGTLSATEPGTYIVKVIGKGNYSGTSYAKWAIKEAYTVTVKIDGTEKSAEQHKNGDSVVVEADTVDGKVFSHWMNNGVKASTNAKYGFIVNSNTTVEAIYVESGVTVEEEPILNLTAAHGSYNGKHAVKFIFDHSLPTGYKVKEVGILYGTNKLLGADTTVTGYAAMALSDETNAANLNVTDPAGAIKNNSTGKIKKYVASYKSRNGHVDFSYSLSDTAYANGIGYIIAENSEGTTVTLYSNYVAASYNSLS